VTIDRPSMSSSLVQHLVSYSSIERFLAKLTRVPGHCSWEPPIGAFIVPRSADGEWWELADASRNNRSYYYSECEVLGGSRKSC
jgi:hypothetical protein